MKVHSRSRSYGRANVLACLCLMFLCVSMLDLEPVHAKNVFFDNNGNGNGNGNDGGNNGIGNGNGNGNANGNGNGNGPPPKDPEEDVGE